MEHPTALNWSLALTIASEFQGFARDLHDIAVDEFVSRAAPANVPLRDVLRTQLTDNRKLDRGNASPGGLGSDFARLGLALWPRLDKAYANNRWNRALDTLNTTRNAIAHADGPKLNEMRAAGYPPTLRTTLWWHRNLDALAPRWMMCAACIWPHSSRRHGPGRRTHMTSLPAVGSLVEIPWGLDVVVGEVVEAYDSGLGGRVVVRVDVSGAASEPEFLTVTMPVDSVVAA